ncbi:alanine racemase [Aureimonas altamirensis DSM 21988]|uniref:Alanine racemase n=1 Tax=Aureimonas altamirensis DSM 21988 TaxID=1121026 RepID=A0ABY1I6K6_9HYPH|nr:alanine racemase [Aureimonas altamirensis]SHI67927.1 alanine racemase [Aureimonas altamirensis DSM 21988]
MSHTDMPRAPFVEIDSWALKSNWRTLAMLAPDARTGAAVKADGYGLGGVIASKALFGAGCRDFFVAWAEEGAEIREAMPGKNCRIFVLQGLDRHAARLCRDERLLPVLSTPEDIELWTMGGEPEDGGLPGVAGLQLETGMHRLGLTDMQSRKAAELAKQGKLDLALVMSHLAAADEPGSRLADEQLDRFRKLANRFPFVARSLANSAAILRGPQFHFDLTRPGICLYGGQTALHAAGALRPVARLVGHVLQVADVKRGEHVGYGEAVKLKRTARIATVGLGYADGYPRSAFGDSVEGQRTAPAVHVEGHSAPIVGRISMDMSMVDISGLPEGAVRPGSEVEFFGPNIPVDAVAAQAGTIAYELLTGIGARVRRVWI